MTYKGRQLTAHGRLVTMLFSALQLKHLSPVDGLHEVAAEIEIVNCLQDQVAGFSNDRALVVLYRVKEFSQILLLCLQKFSSEVNGLLGRSNKLTRR